MGRFWFAMYMCKVKTSTLYCVQQLIGWWWRVVRQNDPITSFDSDFPVHSEVSTVLYNSCSLGRERAYSEWLPRLNGAMAMLNVLIIRLQASPQVAGWLRATWVWLQAVGRQLRGLTRVFKNAVCSAIPIIVRLTG